jgi:N-acylneuraminate cytidylyltransferase/CMP-N,N'-diacetyllegionaminic acid synthase
MIPVRSGSKGVKGKNIRKLCGIPLMGYIINEIKKTNTYQEGGYIFVNTDSQKYANIAKSFGAEIPFLRPSNLATDSSPIIDTIKYTFEKFEEMNCNFDLFAMLQATSPFTHHEDIDKAVNLFKKNKLINSVISVTEVDCPPVWCNTLDENLNMKDFIPLEIRNKNRQELPRYYRIVGAIRMARWNKFKKNNFNWYFDQSKALIIDKNRSLDIDTEEDFLYAEFLMKRMKKNA